MYRLLVFQNILLRGPAVRGFQNRVAQAKQHAGGNSPHGRLVLDQQDGFGPARTAPAGWHRTLRFNVGDLGEVNAKDGAGARLALHLDESAALLDDTVNRGQAQAGPFAYLLGRKEGLEDMRLDVAVDTASGIAHR